MMNKLQGFFYSFLILFGYIFSCTDVHAIGVSPAVVEINDFANGIVLEKELFIVRGNPKTEDTFTVVLEGEGSKYVELSSNKITLPKGVEQFPFKFKLKPVGAANGTYVVKIVFDAALPEVTAASGQNSVAFLSGITAKLKFTITDQQIKKFELSNLRADEAEIDQPMVVHFTVMNAGNVDAKPDSIKLTFVNRMDPTQIFYQEVTSDQITFVGAGKSESLSVKINPKLPLGRYLMKGEFFSEGKLIFTQEIAIEVLPVGTLLQQLDVLSLEVTPQKLGVNESIRLNAKVINSGKIVLEPVFVVKILKDGQQLEFLRSEKQLILKGEEGAFTLSYRPQELGNYTASGYFEYGVRKTEPKEVVFSVEKDNSLKMAIIGGAILIGLLLIIVFIIILIKRHGKKNKDVQSGPVVPVASVQNVVVPLAVSTPVVAEPIVQVPPPPMPPVVSVPPTVTETPNQVQPPVSSTQDQSK